MGYLFSTHFMCLNLHNDLNHVNPHSMSFDCTGEIPEHLADLWLESIARGTMHNYSEQILKIPGLTQLATSQLITDIGEKSKPTTTRGRHWINHHQGVTLLKPPLGGDTQ